MEVGKMDEKSLEAILAKVLGGVLERNMSGRISQEFMQGLLATMVKELSPVFSDININTNTCKAVKKES